MAVEKKVNKTYDISSIKRVTRKFLEVSRFKSLFLLIRPIVVFHHSRCLRRLALHDFIFCLSKL